MAGLFSLLRFLRGLDFAAKKPAGLHLPTLPGDTINTNPKSEIRNSKQIQSSNGSIFKTSFHDC